VGVIAPKSTATAFTFVKYKSLTYLHKVTLWLLEETNMFGIQNYHSKDKYVKELGKFKTESEARIFLRAYNKKKYKSTGVVNWLMYPVNLNEK